MKQPRDAVLVAGSANVDFVVRAAHVPGARRDRARAASSRSFRAARARTRRWPARARWRAHAHAAGARRGCVRAAARAVAARRGRAAARRSRRQGSARGVALICLADDARERDHRGARRECDVARRRICPILDGVGYPAAAARNAARHGDWHSRARRARSGVKVMLNAAPARALPAELLEAVDVLVVNEDELAKVAGRAARCRDVLAALTCRCAIVTLGSRAAAVRASGGDVLSASPPSRSSRSTRPRRATRSAARSPRRWLGLPPARGVAPRERRRSARDDAARRAVEHSGV